ncbi:MAG: aldehyde dehydrogenase family protein [Oligoflexia bacterium]|nr:aldehyde dehydrogenase family protein [Oligoflexia bacterium]
MDRNTITDYFKSSKNHSLSGKTKSYEWRLSALKKLRKGILQYETEILKALQKDLGKSDFEGYVSEVAFVVLDIEHTIKKLKKWMKPKRVSSPMLQWPCRSYIHYEPLGTVLIISPWNYPFQLLMAPLVGALAAGNNAILKPSEVASATAQICEKIISDSFLPEEVMVIQGAVEETTALLELPFDHIFYTGNGMVARIVMEKAAKNLVPVTLELGGKSPCMVLGENDLELVGRRIAWGKFFNTGQTCVAPDYILVEKNQKDELLKHIKNALEFFYTKNPKESPDYGRIINERHWDRITGLYKAEDVLIGGEAQREEHYIAPTLVHADLNSPVMKEEIFGPVLPILEVENVNEALSIVHKFDKPLACYLFSKDSEIEARVVNEISSGGLCVNDSLVHLSSQTLPFGGVGESGLGRYHGEFSFLTFSHQKSVMKRYQILDLLLRYPPYLGKLPIIRKVLNYIG